MSFQTVALQNFRSYESATFNFPGQVSIIVGPNGSGKTNILEALYVLSVTKSFRAAERELVRHGQEWYRLEAATDNGAFSVGAKLQKPLTKKLTHDQKTLKTLNYIGRLPVVLFEPGDLEIATGGPERRRRFLDAVLSTTDQHYLKALLTYRKVLRQRNALLRAHVPRLRDQLFVWDLKLVEQAAVLTMRRLALVEFLNEHIEELYQEISRQSDHIQLAYPVASAQDYGTKLLDRLSRNIERDQMIGHTTAGPHRDELTINFNSKPITATASRGEVRTFLLAAKALELLYIEREHKQKPVLLLDDVFSELDPRRRDYLLDSFKDYQTIITTTDVAKIKAGKLKNYHLIRTDGS